MLNKAAPGHHLHYTLVSPEQANIPGHFEDRAVWHKDQLFAVQP